MVLAFQSKRGKKSWTQFQRMPHSMPNWRSSGRPSPLNMASPNDRLTASTSQTLPSSIHPPTLFTLATSASTVLPVPSTLHHKTRMWQEKTNDFHCCSQHPFENSCDLFRMCSALSMRWEFTATSSSGLSIASSHTSLQQSHLLGRPTVPGKRLCIWGKEAGSEHATANGMSRSAQERRQA